MPERGEQEAIQVIKENVKGQMKPKGLRKKSLQIACFIFFPLLIENLIEILIDNNLCHVIGKVNY